MSVVANAPKDTRLQHFPMGFFSVVMGLTGFSIALHKAALVFAGSPLWGEVSLLLAIAVFFIVAVVYGVKAIRFPSAVLEEWGHPVRVSFFPTFSISLLLISIAVFPTHPIVAQTIWIVGASLQLAFTLAVVRAWIGDRSFSSAHFNPAWFIPAVGNVVVPIAGVSLGFEEASWFFFSIGIVFWLKLMTMVFGRLVFEAPMPDKFLPTLAILIAPPAVAFLAYSKLHPELDPFARILLNSGYFFVALALLSLPKLRSIPFALPWWALSFPLAAITLASFRYSELTQSTAHLYIAVGLLGLLSAVISYLLLRTGLAIYRHEICHPE